MYKKYKKNIIIAITGASGTDFAIILLKRLIKNDQIAQITLLSSVTGRHCLMHESKTTIEKIVNLSDKIRYYNEYDLFRDVSSGSSMYDGMIIIPCSTGTLGRIASGISNSLITRASDVCLKEKRRLILCIRETPLNKIHINNMSTVLDAGAILMPIMPSFYHGPKTLEDLFQAFATRILDQMGINENDHRRWNALADTVTN